MKYVVGLWLLNLMFSANPQILMTDNPIMFVTQYPVAADIATIASTFANHRVSMRTAGRGGGIHIPYPELDQLDQTGAPPSSQQAETLRALKIAKNHHLLHFCFASLYCFKKS
ncbi:hypothetical protein [Marinicella sp. W31]|uniref:hypothetical protein n=1 Tax=Marinicella sp. W31 TaxID=3023713 RepID=UPI0037564E8C